MKRKSPDVWTEETISDQTKYNIITTAKCITFLATEGTLCTLCKFKNRKECSPMTCFRITKFSQQLLDKMEEYYVDEKNEKN